MADAGIYNAILEENKNIQNQIQGAQLQAALALLEETPWDPSGWEFLPLLKDPVGCLCVWNSDTLDGANCTWTVPDGATKVQFQLWGPGAHTAGAQCCAGVPFGANGAYTTVIIDAVPGCQYTLCAGCSTNCFNDATDGATSCGSNTYVTGYGISGLCADSGNPRISCPQCLIHGSSCCRWQAPGRTNSGPCLCENGTSYCFDNSCATCGEIPFVADTNRTYHGTADTGTVYGLPAVFGGGCLDTNNYGYHLSPPHISPCHTVQANSDCCATFTSGDCGGCCCRAVDGARCYPGGGGTHVHVMGGDCFFGDSGRGGMVRVTWC